MYARWRRGTIGLVHPLPCFGRYWDCAFDRGICVERIGVKEALAALQEAVGHQLAAPKTIQLSNLLPETLEVMSRAATTYRKAQRDRAARLEALFQMRGQLAAIEHVR